MSARDAAKAAALVAALAGLFLAFHRKVLAGVLGPLDARQVYDLAQRTVDAHGFNADPLLLTAMASVESNFDATATRVEPHIGDASVGLMQTLVGTARWLATDMGYSAYGVPAAEDLMDPAVSMYFGAAYVHWLSRWKGAPRSEQWIVESYNGGPGASNAQTRNHLAKVEQAKWTLATSL